jgi:hypothetical protein
MRNEAIALILEDRREDAFRGIPPEANSSTPGDIKQTR